MPEQQPVKNDYKYSIGSKLVKLRVGKSWLNVVDHEIQPRLLVGYKNIEMEDTHSLLEVKHAPDQPAIVRGENLEHLKQRLKDPQGFNSYGEVQKWLFQELELNLVYKTVYQRVHYQHKAKLKVPRPQSLKQHPKSQLYLKKNVRLALKFLQDLLGKGKRIRDLCQNETHLGLKTITGRLITAVGVKPLGESQWKRENFYLYGVVKPLTGSSFFYKFFHLDGKCFQRVLEMLSLEMGNDVAVI